MTITNIIRSKAPKKWVDPAATSNMKVHERSKKAGAHRIQSVRIWFIRETRATDYSLDSATRERYHVKKTVALHLRRVKSWRRLSLDIAPSVGCDTITLQAIDFDLEMLQANGIAPPATETVIVQRDSSNKPIDILEIESSDEDEIDRHVNELKVAVLAFFIGWSNSVFCRISSNGLKHGVVPRSRKLSKKNIYLV